MERLAAWSVHVYTATGAVTALLMVHFAYSGRIEAVLWLFLVAMIVDGSDGMLARRLDVKQHAPQIDGALLDNIVDYLTYVFAPVVLLWSTGRLPDGAYGAVVACVPVLASCYQFTRIDAKGVGEHYFLGFPSYWNVVAFYVVVLGLGVQTTTVLLLVLSVLVFVPIRYVYPSRTEALWTLNMALAVLWLGAYAAIVALMPDPPLWLTIASLGYVAYYLAVSIWLTWGAPRRR